jgi:hypothetical protein
MSSGRLAEVVLSALLSWRLVVFLSPVASIQGGFEEFSARVLFVNVLAFKFRLVQCLNNKVVAHPQLLLDMSRVEDERVVLEKGVSPQPMLEPNSTYPVVSQHSPGAIHTDSCNETRLCSQEPVIQEGELHEELAQSSSLQVVVVCFRDPTNPRVR